DLADQADRRESTSNLFYPRKSAQSVSSAFYSFRSNSDEDDKTLHAPGMPGLRIHNKRTLTICGLCPRLDSHQLATGATQSEEERRCLISCQACRSSSRPESAKGGVMRVSKPLIQRLVSSPDEPIGRKLTRIPSIERTNDSLPSPFNPTDRGRRKGDFAESTTIEEKVQAFSL